MIEVGIVKDTFGSKAEVVIMRHAACGDCGVCHVGKEKMTMVTEALNPISALKGDKVEVKMEFSNVIQASFIMYGLPLILFLLGSVIGFYKANIFGFNNLNPMISFIFGLVFTVITYIVIKFLDTKGKFNKKYKPIIIKVIE